MRPFVAVEDLTPWVEIGTLIVETIIVVLLIKTVRDYAEVAKMSRVQTRERFRPWIGPTSGIEPLRAVDGKHQFAVAIKNFGEIPATNVIARSSWSNQIPVKQELLNRLKESNGFEKFVLGPLLPNMEKKYWIFIDSNEMQQAKEAKSELYTFIHFLYEFHGGTSGYGMISRLDPKTGLFVHKEMWVD